MDKNEILEAIKSMTILEVADLVKALEDAGFLLVLELETTSDIYYIVAESEEK